MRLASLLALGLVAGCVSSSSSGWGTSAPHYLTKEEIAAIPTSFPITLVPPRSRTYQPIFDAFTHRDPMEIGDAISKLLRLEQIRVPIVVEECGEANAEYSLRTQTIRICYEFVEYANRLAGRTGADLAIVDYETRALMAFTTLHEIGHALVHQLRLPIEGNEEDRVDELAILIMTNVGDNELARQVVNAPAAFFARHGEATVHQRDDVHSSGGERSFDALCLLYGRIGDPDAKRRIGEHRAQECVDWAGTIRRAWLRWLRPYSRVDNGETF
jgi:hypothetical protein